MAVHVFGVDPGLVDTGLVRLSFYDYDQSVSIGATVFNKADGQDVADAIAYENVRHATFIEGYKPRHNYGTDADMIALVKDIKTATGGKVLLNTGVKRVVKQPLMELLGVWSFDQATNHQDLRSAARIALLGMLKDSALNEVLANVVHDHLRGEPWSVFK